MNLLERIHLAGGTTNISGRLAKHAQFTTPPPDDLKREMLAAGWVVVVSDRSTLSQ